MITSDKLQSSIEEYSYQFGDEIVWAPYLMNGGPCRPSGEKLSIPEGGKASPHRFQAITSFAVQTLIDRGVEPTSNAIRLSLVDGSLPVENGIDHNYRAGIDCSGFAYFALKGSGLDIDNAIVATPSMVRLAADRTGWHPDHPDIERLVERAADKALSLNDFTKSFYSTPEPHKSVNTARFDDSSSLIPHDDAQPGDIIIYRRAPDVAPNHIALITDVESNGDINLVHSGRASWDKDPGGIENFTISREDLVDYYDEARGFIELKRITALK